MRWLSDDAIGRLQKLAELPDMGDGRYVLGEELGRGGMGTVYLAHDKVLGRAVALKVAALIGSDSEPARRMIHEARITARLEHPGIVPIHDVDALPDGRVFYAMKRVAGERLDAASANATLAERLRIFQRICEAIAFAHAHGVIHRDLKPENVMVGPFGEVLVMDWGVAKVLEEANAERVDGAAPAALPAPPATADGTIVGTPAYMAPEQAEGRVAEIGRATDVYALGAILYFLLTRRPPFEGAAAAKRLEGAASIRPVAPRHWVSDLPRPLEAIVVKAMSPLAADRYRSADALSADVARFVDGERVVAYRESWFERAGRFAARYQTAIFLILAYLFMRTALILYVQR